MILNSSSLINYPYSLDFALSNIHTSTWFINTREVFEVKTKYQKTKENFIYLIEAIFGIIVLPSQYSFEINEIGISLPSQPQTFLDYSRQFFRASIPTSTYRTISCDTTRTFNDLKVNLNKLSDNFNFVNIEIGCWLNVKNKNGKIDSQFFENFMIIHIYPKENDRVIDSSRDTVQSGKLSDICISISISFWSLLRSDNRKEIMMSYLFEKGCLQVDKKEESKRIHELLGIEELNRIFEKVQKKLPIFVTVEEHEFYEYCIVSLPDHGDLFLQKNTELARLNCPTLLSFIEELERTLDRQVSRKIPDTLM
ncbi:hypothetical protein IQ249_17080 [Lusitaniella coriacea LEGE 07157]|uniref:Uncharacterized protein n=1 Tax=Lusitaniella coriacea LEGE 07157 TaxID=945747 RepID=A0A8J7E2I4_9CYAN|nr:hypothetical protein [Lusitaniella coriacea]MBE9117614.1 hypothetical protein [Lusitaniella coriacea LEGE 07157]